MMYPPFAVFSPALAGAAALAAVGVPLVIHLLFRKRYQVVPWAAIRFLLVAERRHKRRIDQWLLLILRTLALMLFLFAMVATIKPAEDLWQAIRPGAAETVANVPRTHHVIVIDASLSMTARTEDGRTRFEVAIDQAKNLVRSSSPGDGFTVLRMAGTAEVVVPGPSNDPEKVVAELQKLRPTHGPADHAAALNSVADTLTRSPRVYPRRQLTFFSDLQRASWAAAIPRPENSTADLWQRITARADVAVVDTARAESDNLAVAELTLSDPMPLVDQPVSVTVTVANLGRTEKKNVRVDLLLGRPSGGTDSLAAIDQKPLDPIPAGTRGSVRFDLTGPQTFRDRGIHVFQARLVDGDGLPADDTRALAVEVRDGIHTLLVEGKADPDPNRRAATHLYRALFPPGAKPTDTPNRPREPMPVDKFLDPNVADLASADGRGSPVDCVFVCDVFNPGPELAAKLDAVLRRGGTVVIGLGPNAAASRAQYNAVLYRDGAGVLPGPLGDVVAVNSPDEPGFRLFAEDEEYRKPPLAPFASDKVRPGLINVPFDAYVKLDAPPEGAARRIMTFARAGASAPDPKAGPATRPDPALVEWQRHRGRVYVFTSTFNEEWSKWPAAPTYLMFWHEFLKYSVARPDRHTLRVGEKIEEFFPANSAGLTAGLNGPEGAVEVQLVLQDEAGVATFKQTELSGLYRLGIGGSRDRVFAVNVPAIDPGSPSESDLHRIDRQEFKAAVPVQVVTDAMDVKPTGESGAFITTTPKPWGPIIARIAVVAAVLILAAELLLAWQFGPSRTGATHAPAASRSVGRRLLRLAGTLATFLPLGVAAFALFTVLHAERTGNPLGFLPHGLRSSIEHAARVPAAGPGEGTKWRLEGATAFFRNAVTDRRVVAAIAVLCLAITAGTYWMERRAVGGFRRVAIPMLLRAGTFLLALFILLAQLKLAFEREGLPEVVILLDTSASMEHRDPFQDEAVRAKAAELAGTNLPEATRLRLAQLLLTRKDADWLDRLLREKQVRVHLYAVDVQARPLSSVNEESDIAEGRAAIERLKPEGEGSHLGDGVQEVLKAFRGSPLAAIIMFTDGVNTAGDDLPRAARAASLDGVPLFLVGVGDTWETPDLALTDLQAEDVVGRGDRLAFEARLTAHGRVPGAPVTALLKEKMPDGKTEVVRGQKTVTPDPSGNPVAVTLDHTPAEVGEKTFVLEVPAAPGEVNTRNNRIERTVLVTDSRRLRVLYVEGYPRYDFRFVKVMLERESDKSLGGKSVEVQVVLLDASKGWPETDRSAFRGEFPTRTELFGFDVVILGDVDPKLIGGSRSAVVLRDLADFVRQKGGGLLFLSGQHGTPAAYADTPLADVLPVIPTDAPAVTRPPEEQPITEEFQPKLTPAGRMHPLFRFSADEGESARIWGRLKPLYWYAKGYRRKPLTNVLAEHPTRPAEGGRPGEMHPLVVQQFAGAGPVLFLGFDDTWRWRFRNEEHFDRFWMQSVRVLSRSRVRRPEVRVVDKTEFRRGEKVTVQVRFPVEAPAPGGDAPIRVVMTRSPLAKPDGTPGPGQTETATLVLNRIPNRATGEYEATLTRAPEGEYRFELTDPEVQGSRPSATARVLPPMSERERTEMNRRDLQAAAALSGGGFYTLDKADGVIDDLKNLQRVPLNQPVQPIPLWNQPAVYALVMFLLLGEWLLRKRERLL